MNKLISLQIPIFKKTDLANIFIFSKRSTPITFASRLIQIESRALSERLFYIRIFLRAKRREIENANARRRVGPLYPTFSEFDRAHTTCSPCYPVARWRTFGN